MKNKTFAKPLEEKDFVAYDEWSEWCNQNQYEIIEGDTNYYCKKIDTTKSGIEGKIISLKHQLTDLDYKTNKYLEGELTKEEWEIVIATRKDYRNQINKLEEKLNGLS